MEKEFEKIADFNGEVFLGLWNDFNCRCYVNEDVVLVTFFKPFFEPEENRQDKLIIKGNNAVDLLDYVLSEYYKGDNLNIEDCFNSWLIKNYKVEDGKVEYTTDLPFDNVSWEEKYKCLLSDWNNQNDNIKFLCRTIKAKNKRIKRLKARVKELEKELKESNEYV